MKQFSELISGWISYFQDKGVDIFKYMILLCFNLKAVTLDIVSLLINAKATLVEEEWCYLTDCRGGG